MQNAAATFDVKDIENGKHALSVTVPTPAEKRFYVQILRLIDKPLSGGKSYTLSFRAKSTPDTQIVVFLNAAGTPPATLMKQDNIPLSSDWKNLRLHLYSQGRHQLEPPHHQRPRRGGG